ncbi:hypothetical protein AVEN_160899-1 [Araneus ventricosus]|uniref:Uncharacterized protein n=1 Tax=Araneus ventricosus TaxID=182803 RepID=A0A4Y2D3E6_ARAVE|nr:hypothetical protein AVEN_160899-1 [Araneus ventricosus]
MDGKNSLGTNGSECGTYELPALERSGGGYPTYSDIHRSIWTAGGRWYVCGSGGERLALCGSPMKSENVRSGIGVNSSEWICVA